MPQLLQRRRLPFDFDQHVPRLVPNEAAQSQARGEVVHERAEPDALDDATDGNGEALHTRILTAGVRTVARQPQTCRAACSIARPEAVHKDRIVRLSRAQRPT